MATLKELLGEAYREDMTLADIENAISTKKLADLSSGEYVSKGKAMDFEARAKKAEKALAERMTEDERKQVENEQREQYYKQLEREVARTRFVSKLGKTIKDDKVLNDIADLYANGEFEQAIDKQNEYLSKYHKEMEKVIKDELMKTNPQSTPQGQNSSYKTKDEIMAIKDTATRQKAISENLDLFNS